MYFEYMCLRLLHRDSVPGPRWGTLLSYLSKFLAAPLIISGQFNFTLLTFGMVNEVIILEISAHNITSTITSNRWNIITVQHGSADTAVRAMNAFNGKCRFSWYDSSETRWPIFKKMAQLITLHTRFGVNRYKGGVSAHA